MGFLLPFCFLKREIIVKYVFFPCWMIPNSPAILPLSACPLTELPRCNLSCPILVDFNTWYILWKFQGGTLLSMYVITVGSVSFLTKQYLSCHLPASCMMLRSVYCRNLLGEQVGNMGAIHKV